MSFSFFSSNQLKISDLPIEKMSNIIEPQQNEDKARQEQPEDIRIEVITHEDTDEILSMLKEYFFKVSSPNSDHCLDCLNKKTQIQIWNLGWANE